MATSKINLDIGTTYKGEGFKRLNAALEQSTGRTRRAASSWAKMHQSAAKSAIGAWTEFYSKIKIISGAVQGAWNGLKLVLSKSFNFETQQRQFTYLIGNIDEAKRHMQDLKELGDTPPFSLDEFARASRQLMVLSDGVLGTKQSLQLVGDAAAATGQSLDTLSHGVGLLYATIRDGQPVGRAAGQLRNIGVLTPELVKRLDEMQKAGASSVEMWEEVVKALEKFKGAMEATEDTGNGLVGAISSRWDNIVRQFGDAFTDTAKGGMKDALDAMKELEDSGFARWLGDEVLSAITSVANAISGLYKQLSEGKKFWADFFGGAKEDAGDVAEAVERILVEETKPNEYTTRRKYQRSDGAEEYEYVVDEKKEKEVKAAQREAEQKEKQLAALREADEKRKAAKAEKEAKEAEEAAKKKAEADKKAAEAAEEKWWQEEQKKRREAQLFVEAYEAEKRAAEEAERKAEVTKKLAEKQKEAADKQEDLNNKIVAAKGAVSDWIANVKNNRKLGFHEFNKMQNQLQKENAVQIGVDQNGNKIAIDKKQANQVAANRRNLDRLLKIRNPDKRTQQEIARRQAFDDMFNPEKLKERQAALQKLERERAEAEKKMKNDIAALKKMLVDNNGVAL